VPLGLYHVWHYLYFGELVPNTYYAKAGARTLPDLYAYVTEPGDPGFTYVRSFFSDYWLLPSFSAGGFSPKGSGGLTHDAAAILIPFAVLALLTPRGLTHYSLPLLMLLTGLGAVLFDGGDNMHYRLMSPLIPLFYLMVQESIRVVSVGVSRLPVPGSSAVVQATLAVAIAGVVLGSTLAASIDRLDELRVRPYVAPYSIVEKRADRLNRLSRCLEMDQASVLTPDVGGIAYKTDLLIVDLVGLGDRFIARHPSGPAFLDYVLEERRPDIISTHQVWLKGLDLDPRFLERYAPVLIERDEGGRLEEGVFVRRDLAMPPSCAADLASIDEEAGWA